jgi:hypothetical protein
MSGPLQSPGRYKAFRPSSALGPSVKRNVVYRHALGRPFGEGKCLHCSDVPPTPPLSMSTSSFPKAALSQLVSTVPGKGWEENAAV